MTELSADLESFLDVVAKVAGSAVADDGGLTQETGDLLAAAGLLELAPDTSEEPDGLQWLAHTVRVASRALPSLGFALAARYAGDRAVGTASAAGGAAFCLHAGLTRPVVPTVLEPRTVVALDVDERVLRTAAWSDVAGSAGHEARSGLRGARLASVTVPGTASVVDGDAREAMRDWDLLLGAVLVGLAQSAVDTTSAYVLERRQFGQPIGSFAGLRALVAEMAMKADSLHALLSAGLDHHVPSEDLAATAGRAATEICIDAIQAHGGYGYIEEYPVAGLLRDSLSLQARAGGRRLHVARVAERRLGLREEAQA